MEKPTLEPMDKVDRKEKFSIKKTEELSNTDNTIDDQSGGKKRYVEIGEDDSPDLGIDLEAMANELNELRVAEKKREEEREVENDLRFEWQLKDKVREIIKKSQPDLTDEELKKSVVNEGKLILERVVTRAHEEVGFNPQLDSTRYLTDLAKPSFLYGLFIRTRKALGLKSAGTYSPLFGVRIDKETSELKNLRSPFRILRDLADKGFNESLYTLHHEIIHSTQKDEKQFMKEVAMLAIFAQIHLQIYKHYPEVSAPLLAAYAGTRLYFLQKRARKNLLTDEPHAEIGAHRWGGGRFNSAERFLEYMKYRQARESPDRLLELIFGHELNKNEDFTDRYLSIYTSLRRLYALGLSDQEIGDLMGKAEWNKERARFDVLDDRIQEEIDKKRKETGKDWTEADVDNLVLADDLRKWISLYKIRHIAQQELDCVLT